MKTTSRSRRAFVLGALAGAAAGPAVAADPPAKTYAVLSLIGDQFSVVTRRPVTGTQIDPNQTLAYPLGDAFLDGVAASAVDRAVRAAAPEAGLLRFSIRDPRLFALQDRLLAPGSDSDGVREALRGLLSQAGATHLLVVTKRRDEASFDLVYGTMGGGKINGVGFYIDNLNRVRLRSTDESSQGYLAAFAYVTATLVDAGKLRVLGSRSGSRSIMTSPGDDKDAAVAWQATTSAQKVAQLEQVVDGAVFDAARGALATG